MPQKDAGVDADAESSQRPTQGWLPLPCLRNRDCVDFPDSQCKVIEDDYNRGQDGEAYTYGFYGCAVDFDCDTLNGNAPSSICSCPDESTVGTCIKTTCKTDADCGERLFCADFDKSRHRSTRRALKPIG